MKHLLILPAIMFVSVVQAQNYYSNNLGNYYIGTSPGPGHTAVGKVVTYEKFLNETNNLASKLDQINSTISEVLEMKVNLILDKRLKEFEEKINEDVLTALNSIEQDLGKKNFDESIKKQINSILSEKLVDLRDSLQAHLRTHSGN